MLVGGQRAQRVYFERCFGPIHGWRALLRAVFGRGDPAPASVEAALPAFEEYVVRALAHRDDLTRDDIRAIMRVEGEAGPGDPDPKVRQRLFEMAEAHKPPFQDRELTGGPPYTMVYRWNLLERSPVPLGVEDIGAEVRRNWADFMAVKNGEAVGDFWAISAVIEAQQWLRAAGANGT